MQATPRLCAWRRKRKRAPEKANVRVRRVMKGNPLERIFLQSLMSIEDRNRVLAQCLGRPIRNTREGTKSARASCLLAFGAREARKHPPFALPPHFPYIPRQTRWPGSRWYAGNCILEESPGSRWTGRRLTAARREPRESATERKPPEGFGQRVRVKGWGKSPPQRWQQGWHGKPRPEQDQVGGTYGLSAARAPGASRRGVQQ